MEGEGEEEKREWEELSERACMLVRMMEKMKNRREWEWRWREAGDIMNEEDVMGASIMHLCIPDYIQNKEEDGLILPSWCSLNALSVMLNEISIGDVHIISQCMISTINHRTL